MPRAGNDPADASLGDGVLLIPVRSGLSPVGCSARHRRYPGGGALLGRLGLV